ncbi:GAF domain-containing SpoIIE family protein phosphatase [Streptomyces sp. NPDC012438]|uniref:GAF domain-containing SpoIIE family protein phosphatase n=1 Tax=Streptomyces sp. NPDC012438 TaxID=3364833 RepID=UPI0036E8030B
MTLSRAVRDATGLAVDMRLEYMNAAARAGQPDGAAPLGGLCGELWPQMTHNGSFAACMRVLNTGRAEHGAFHWTQASTYRAADYEYQATRLGSDHLLWVLRDNSERVLRAELLARLTAALTAAGTLAHIMTILTEEVMPAVGATVGAAVLGEPGSDQYTVRHIHDAEQPTRAPAPFSVTAPYPMAHTARTGQALFFTDPAERTEAFPEAAPFFSERYHSTAVLPLATEDHLFGAVSFHFGVRHDFADSERGFLAAVVGQCAQAIERVRLHQEAARKQAQLEALAEISAVLAESFGPGPIAPFDTMVAAFVPRIADGCLIYTVDRTGQPELAALAHTDPAQQQALRATLEEFPPRLDAEGGVGAVIRTGRHELVTDVPSELDRLARSPQHRLALHKLMPAASWLAVPLRRPESVVGAMVLIQSPPAHTLFTERDVPFARELARRATQTLVQARYLAVQSEVAHYLQQSLLPPDLPHMPGVEIAACYHPGDQGTLVGGDFYDIVPTTPTSWALTIGDVCGKGPTAAALTGLVRHTARAAGRWNSEPRAVLQAVNDAIIAGSSAHIFCTAAHADLETSTSPMRLRLVLGGHPHPLLRRADGTVVRIGTAGTFLGVLADPPLHTTETDLYPGDLLLFFTDGVTEHRSGTSMFSEEGVRDLLASLPRSSAAETVAALEEKVIAYGAKTPEDDIAMLAIRIV